MCPDLTEETPSGSILVNDHLPKQPLSFWVVAYGRFEFKVARYSFSRSIPPKFKRKLRRHKQRFGKIDTTVVLDKDENLL